ncbi:ABC transporter ATP-binding protein [[Mycobacterium] kokjensenii]|uniref:ABC transporter ATP-binding protein n=1 Tax=[Mycobacterium] kokjensenii TaxID=3064287 RepID=A0ABM9LSW7_9MYCO|nr:ABC transporter ATP-binding protein [Mycolicibacter sp. MU0083]CAJ1504201.1 ABC transporter ATP-binding protein [Mycolicibacter sp. MU0083]
MYIRRSLAMLHTVRGAVALSVLLGLFVTALPFVSNAAFGPLMQAVAAAGVGGDLADVWGQQGSLLTRESVETSGLIGWLATPLTFALLLAIWAASLVLAQALGFVNAWIGAHVERRLLATILQRVHDHMQSLSLDFFVGARTGVLIQRVQLEAPCVQRLLTDCVVPPVIDAVVLLIALSYLLVLSWPMTIISLVLAPLALAGLRFAGQRLQTVTQRAMVANRVMSSELAETTSGISEIQVFNAQRRRSALFRASSMAATKNMAAMRIWMQAATNGAQVFIALSIVLVLITGVVFGARFGLTFAGLVVFIAYVPTMFAAVQRMVLAYTTYKSILPHVASTYELLDTGATVRERPDAAVLPAVKGDLVFDDVSFRYSPKQQILQGLSFSVAAGEIVALVGPIGSGKSTVFNLLLRFLDPQHGRILVDGNDIGAVTLHSLREQVCKLAQFPFFLKDTIRENVRLGRHDATDGEVEEACAMANVHAAISDPAKMRNGYDTIIDVQVPSGGQKRLIALARCLLRRPRVLLLDEPTENLDSDQRAKVTALIRNHAGDRTCLVISHDMDFIEAVADRIIVLHHGRAVEQGTHQELLALGGLYSQLCEADRAEP